MSTYANIPYRERRTYFYPCSSCGRRAKSYRKRRLRTGLCRKCRLQAEQTRNMTPLFKVNEPTPQTT